MEVLWTISVPILAVITGVHRPRTEGFIYAVVDNDIEIPWLKTVSVAAQTFYVFHGSLFRVFYQAFQVYVTRTCTLCADLLSSTPSSSEESPVLHRSVEITQNGILEAFERNVDNYRELRRIVQRFNEANAWALFAYKGVTLMFCTLMLYYPSRKSRVNESQEDYFICYACALGIMSRIFVLLYVMGQFYAASERFGHNWKRFLAGQELLSERHSAILHCCAPLGFESGDFYVVKPSTVLTFYSVLLSYVIFVFQI